MCEETDLVNKLNELDRMSSDSASVDVDLAKTAPADAMRDERMQLKMQERERLKAMIQQTEGECEQVRGRLGAHRAKVSTMEAAVKEAGERLTEVRKHVQLPSSILLGAEPDRGARVSAGRNGGAQLGGEGADRGRGLGALSATAAAARWRGDACHVRALGACPAGVLRCARFGVLRCACWRVAPVPAGRAVREDGASVLWSCCSLCIPQQLTRHPSTGWPRASTGCPEPMPPHP